MRDVTKYWALANGSYMETTDSWAEADADHPGAVTDPEGLPWVLAVHTEPPAGATELTAAVYGPLVAAQVAAEAKREADDAAAQDKAVAADLAAAPSRATARAAVLTRLGLTEADLALLLSSGQPL